MLLVITDVAVVEVFSAEQSEEAPSSLTLQGRSSRPRAVMPAQSSSSFEWGTGVQAVVVELMKALLVKILQPDHLALLSVEKRLGCWRVCGQAS